MLEVRLGFSGSLTLGKPISMLEHMTVVKEEKADRPRGWDGVQALTVTIVSGCPPGPQSQGVGGGRAPTAA